MFTKIISPCLCFSLCLAGINSFCFAETNLAVPIQKLKNNSALSADVKQFEFGPFKLQAEDLEVRVIRDGTNWIRLKGHAQIICGSTFLSADEIVAHYKDEHDLRISLKETVKIENERDNLRVTAHMAVLDYHGKFMQLMGGKWINVTLTRSKDQKTTAIKASRILVKYKNLHTMLIKAMGEVTKIQRGAIAEDFVELESEEQSEFDFFDAISITDVQYYSDFVKQKQSNAPIQAKKPQLTQ